MVMKIAVLPGDGIGKEVTAQAVKVLKAVAGGEAEFTEGLIGGAALRGEESTGKGNKGLYEPVHRSAPDIEGKDIANPLAAILSAAMLLRYSFGRGAAAASIERAVRAVLAKGYRTQDILQPGTVKVGTSAMGDAILAALT